MEKRTCVKCHESKLNESYRTGRSTCKKCENKIRYQQKQERRKVDPEYDRQIKDYDVKRKRKLEKENPLEGFKQMVRSNTRAVFRIGGYRKDSKSHDLHKVTWETFKLHIENQFTDGMNWGNRGEWELDHIIPISLALNMTEVTELSYYINYRPMWSLDNKLKSNRIYFDELSDEMKIRYKKFIDRYLGN